MSAVESRAEVYLMAFRSLPKAERKRVLDRLLEDPELREDMLDLAVIRERENEPTRPFKQYLAERKKRARKE